MVYEVSSTAEQVWDMRVAVIRAAASRSNPYYRGEIIGGDPTNPPRIEGMKVEDRPLFLKPLERRCRRRISDADERKIFGKEICPNPELIDVASLGRIASYLAEKKNRGMEL